MLAFIGACYLRLVGLSSRLVWINREIRDRLEAEGKGFIYAFWHGRQFFLVYLHGGDRLRPVVSRSGDGELIARVCRSFGLDCIRGSTSRGAAGALRQMIDEIQAGARVGITPDGPRGPLRRVQPGVLYLAQKTGRPIVPVAYGARQRWRFGSWDEFLVPGPFNRISMVYGAPLNIGPGDDLARRAADLERALNEVTRSADRAAGARIHE